ncbi:hypothetical protein OSK93_24360, partial [Escherichia coli]|nr:hypothetical protein [Escherichia coli]
VSNKLPVLGVPAACFRLSFGASVGGRTACRSRCSGVSCCRALCRRSSALRSGVSDIIIS